ncbi:MAG TPA: cytochrome c-type biogenesis protein [Burkholderiales bacterium]|nr:cytochrome c-type biogenesis protein [Burkholderiales bacterium]
MSRLGLRTASCRLRLHRALLLGLLLWTASPLHSEEAAPAAPDPALEARVMRLADELRCLVCQNQTIADSQAGLAIDLRNQIREKMQQGSSDEQIRDYMVARYGDFVLYRPPLKATTWLLWFGPLGLAGVGVLVLFTVLRRRKALPQPSISPAQRKQAAALLLDQGEGQ